MIEAFEIAEQHYELEIKKLIVLTNLMLYPIEEGLTCDHIIEGKLKNHPTESLSCGVAFVNDNVYHPAKHKVYHLL